MKTLFCLVVAAFTMLTTATAAGLPGVNFDSTNCVDKTGFDSCYNTAVNTFDACFQQECNSNDITICGQACICTAYFSSLSCVLQSCWNRVYSCDHQSMQIAAYEYCGIVDLAGFPYFLVPENAPGSCTCNLALIFNSILFGAQERNTCIDGSLDTQYDAGCVFCQLDSDVSSYYNVCPNTDPALINNITGTAQAIPFAALESYTASPTTTYDCASQSFSAPGYSTDAPFLAPGSLPPTGTGSFSDGSGSITSPISGATITWTFASNLVATVVAAKESAIATASVPLSGGSSSVVIADSSSGTMSGTSSTSTGIATSGGASTGTSTSTSTSTSTNKSLSSTFKQDYTWKYLLAFLLVLSIII